MDLPIEVGGGGLFSLVLFCLLVGWEKREGERGPFVLERDGGIIHRKGLVDDRLNI